MLVAKLIVAWGTEGFVRTKTQRLLCTKIGTQEFQLKFFKL